MSAHHAHSSGHHHHHDTAVDWEHLVTQLEQGGELQLPALRQIATRLGELHHRGTPVRRVLDVGSGPGVMTGVLAEAFPDARVIAFDGAAGLLARAAARAKERGYGDRVVTRQGDFADLLDGDPGGDSDLGAADLIWSSKAVHHLGDQQAALTGLARLLRPGGLLAVAEGGLPMRYLPRDIGIGEPGLQVRLDAAESYWFSQMRVDLPGSVAVVEDWPAMLTRAGLSDAGSFTALLDLPAPLGEPGRAYLHGHLSRLREKAETLSEQDRDTLDTLLDPSAEAGILRRPDAFLLSATTVFTAARTA